MILLICAGIGLLLAISIAVTVCAMYRAPLGYEDESGFHFEGQVSPAAKAVKVGSFHTPRRRGLVRSAFALVFSSLHRGA